MDIVVNKSKLIFLFSKVVQKTKTFFMWAIITGPKNIFKWDRML